MLIQPTPTVTICFEYAANIKDLQRIILVHGEEDSALDLKNLWKLKAHLQYSSLIL